MATCEQLYRLLQTTESLPQLKIEKAQKQKDIDERTKREQELVGTKIAPELTIAQQQLQAALKELARKMADAKSEEKRLIDLQSMVQATRQKAAHLAEELNRSLLSCLNREYSPVRLDLNPDPTPIITDKLATVRKRLADLQGAPNVKDSQAWCVKELEKITTAMNLGVRIVKELKEVQTFLNSRRLEVEALGKKITEIETDSPAMRARLQASRVEDYVEVFKTLWEEQEVLASLYAPITGRIAAASGDLRGLALVLDTVVDFESWFEKGLALFDSRRFNSDNFERDLKAAVIDSWHGREPELIRKGIVESLNLIAEKFSQGFHRTTTTQQDLSRWLFSTDHIRYDYGLTYNGLTLDKLSQGTCGMVLLMLYLELDRDDLSPLLIDQPEENLDPKTVYEVLVPYVRQAKKRRQIVLVTHNPNLVVNTDAEMVIVANSTVTDPQHLPQITYKFGGLEDPEIRDEVCSILEGGEKAFRDRDRRYGGAVFAERR